MLSVRDALLTRHVVLQATPHLSVKRKSLHGRRLRPKSVVDSVEGVSADDIPSRLSPGAEPEDDEDGGGDEESLDYVSELPAGGPPAQQLQHLVKGRPRRAKTRAPTRPMVRALDDEGLDVFWRAGSIAAPSGGHSDQNTPATEHACAAADTPRSRSSDSIGCSPVAARRSPPRSVSGEQTAAKNARPWSLADVPPVPPTADDSTGTCTDCVM